MIKKKIFRCINSISSSIENDVQGGILPYKTYIHIYIHSDSIALRTISDEDSITHKNPFGLLPQLDRKKIEEGITHIIEEINNPISVGNYLIYDKSKIEMRWHFFRGGETEILFKGEVLLDGDAIKGIFYKNGEVSVSERVYYNIDKPLPRTLIA